MLNWKQHVAFVVVYIICYIVCYQLTMFNPEYFSQSCLGMLDNGPLIYLGLLGLDPEGPVMKWFEKLKCDGKWLGWLKSPLFLAVFINATVNTMTDGFGALGDPTSSFIGVVFVVIASAQCFVGRFPALCPFAPFRHSTLACLPVSPHAIVSPHDTREGLCLT